MKFHIPAFSTKAPISSAGYFTGSTSVVASDTARVRKPFASTARRMIRTQRVAGKAFHCCALQSCGGFAGLLHVPSRSHRFKGSLDTVRHWAAVIHASANQQQKQSQLINRMLALIAGDLVAERPNRSEPRAKKRRPKNYHLLTKPRNQTGDVPRRNRPNPNPKIALS